MNWTAVGGHEMTMKLCEAPERFVFRYFYNLLISTFHGFTRNKVCVTCVPNRFPLSLRLVFGPFQPLLCVHDKPTPTNRNTSTRNSNQCNTRDIGPEQTPLQ
jgi:hypothetical protein